MIKQEDVHSFSQCQSRFDQLSSSMSQNCNLANFLSTSLSSFHQPVFSNSQQFSSLHPSSDAYLINNALKIAATSTDYQNVLHNKSNNVSLAANDDHQTQSNHQLSAAHAAAAAYHNLMFFQLQQQQLNKQNQQQHQLITPIQSVSMHQTPIFPSYDGYQQSHLSTGSAAAAASYYAVAAAAAARAAVVQREQNQRQDLGILADRSIQLHSNLNVLIGDDQLIGNERVYR